MTVVAACFVIACNEITKLKYNCFGNSLYFNIFGLCVCVRGVYTHETYDALPRLAYEDMLYSFVKDVRFIDLFPFSSFLEHQCQFYLKESMLIWQLQVERHAAILKYIV